MPLSPTDPSLNPTADSGGLAALDQGINQADGMDEAAQKERAKEETRVKKFFAEYNQARNFDKDARRQYAIDRRYAAGTVDKRWAVNTNLIGSFIDILVSFLYARNPDVSVKKSPQTNDQGTAAIEDIARTAEIIVSRLWKQGRLKEVARRMVRSTLATGIGWLKAVLICEGTNIPEMESKLSDQRDNLEKLSALQKKFQEHQDYTNQMTSMLTDPNGVSMDSATMDSIIPPSDPPTDDEWAECDTDADSIASDMTALQEQIEALDAQIEVAIRKTLAIDFVSSENVQVSLDVRSITDYRNANWISNDIYRTKEDAISMFPKLQKSDLEKATAYYQRRTQDTVVDYDMTKLDQYSGVNAEDADQFTTTANPGGNGGTSGNDESSVAFVKVIERWDRRTGHIYTAIDGVSIWAKDPYVPDYKAERFYPYFQTAFYDVDGHRHPQSLSWRLHKLQDEYAMSRSQFRLMRSRNVPGILVNGSGLSPEEVRKIEGSTEQEYIVLKPVNPEQKLTDLFAAKPTANLDMRMYDNTMILQDMEKIAGVQEALQSSTSPEKTATEAEIQQTGFASRTTADRDNIEEMLTELAQYTAQLALQGIDVQQAQRMAGAGAMWPVGMDIEDLHTMVELSIEAGTTGKPKAQNDREAWGVILPQIKESIMQIQQALVTGNVELANSLKALVQETMRRFGDDTDLDKFIPAIPAVPQLPGTPGGLPMPPGALAPGAGPEGGGPPPPADPSGLPPGSQGDLAVPDIQNPVIAPPI